MCSLPSDLAGSYINTNAPFNARKSPGPMSFQKAYTSAAAIPIEAVDSTNGPVSSIALRHRIISANIF